MQWDIGIDFGETGVRLATRAKGVALCSPCWGAMREGEIIAIGDSALNMLGRNPQNIAVEKPVSGGTLEQPRLAAQWISRLIEPFVSAGRLSRPSVVFSDSGLYRKSEKELITAAAAEVGAQAVGWADADILSAAGAGMDIMEPAGRMLVNVGAGVLSACLISGGRIVHAERLPWGAARVDHDIAHLVRSGVALAIGPRTAEEIKLSLGSALPAREMKMRATGLDLAGGFPAEKEISADLVRPAVEPLVDALATLMLCCVENAPEELSADLVDAGAVLSGGGALLSGLAEALEGRTGISCRLCDTPELATISGMAAVLADAALSEHLIRQSAMPRP